MEEKKLSITACCSPLSARLAPRIGIPRHRTLRRIIEMSFFAVFMSVRPFSAPIDAPCNIIERQHIEDAVIEFERDKAFIPRP